MDPKVLMFSAVAAAAVGGFVIGYLVGKSGSAPAKKSGGNQKSKKVYSGSGVELYVGNLSYDIDDNMLTKEFASFGKVVSARVIKNKYNDRSRGYGFVEMANEKDADKAVKATHGKEILGRKLVVNVARSNSRD
jgi:RNA recognition motif-containing protein